MTTESISHQESGLKSGLCHVGERGGVAGGSPKDETAARRGEQSARTSRGGGRFDPVMACREEWEMSPGGSNAPHGNRLRRTDAATVNLLFLYLLLFLF